MTSRHNVSNGLLRLRAWGSAHTRLITIALTVAGIVAYYFWTALTNLPTDDVARDGIGFYGLLGDAFAHGHLSLGVQPDPQLLALPNPYDPAANAPFRVHDASLYNGHYYLYFGPTPALVLFAPAHLLGVIITEPFACAAFASIALIAAAWLIAVLLGRFAPRVGIGMTALIVLVVGMANGIPFTLRRPAVYETAITAGLACSTVVALLVALTLTRRHRGGALLGAAGLTAGLAAGARPHLALIMLLPLFAVIHFWRTEGSHVGRRLLVASTAPFLLFLCALALYNIIRFGSAFEFGSHYQLSGVDQRTMQMFDLARLIPGIFFYFFSAPSFSSTFPFVSLAPEWPGGGMPSSYTGVEPVAGALLIAPIIILGMAAMIILVSRRVRHGSNIDLGYLVMLTATALAIALVTILTIPSATQRYEADWLTLMLVASMTALGILMVRCTARWRRPIGAAMIALGAYSCVVGAALGMTGYFDAFRLAHPETYASIEDAVSFVPTLSARASGEPVVQHVSPISAGDFLLQFVVGGRGSVMITMEPTTVLGTPPDTYRAVVTDPATRSTATARARAGVAARVPFAAHHGINRVTVRLLAPSSGGAGAPANLSIDADHIRIAYAAQPVASSQTP